QRITGLELCLDLGGRIKGDCVRADGNPQPGRWVAIEQAGYRHHNEEDRIAQVRTDENGEFSFDGVPTGEIRVMLGNTSPSGPWYPFLQERVVTLMRAETIHVRFETPLHPWER